MAKTFHYLALALAFSCFLVTGWAQPVNTNISNGIGFDGEPFIAINPLNGQNIVAAWMGLKLSGASYKIAIRTRASFDGGATWSTENALPHHGTGYTSADVSMGFDRGGLLYISYIDSHSSLDSGGVYVARSTDGGLNWDTPTKAFDAYDVPGKLPVDRPWLVVDQSNTVNAGTLYITTKPAPWIPAPNRNYYKVSTDSGHTWTSIRNVDGGTHLVGNVIAAPMAAPSTTINGNFCAVYPSYLNSQNIYPAYYLATSKDQGQSFSYTTVISGLVSPLDTNLKGGYHLASPITDSNKLVLLLTDAASGDADITAVHSNDGGQTWSSRIRVNDDSTGNGKDQDMVWGNYNEQGKLAVTWRDRRNGPNGFWNAGYDFYYALSTDNGQTFSANKKLSSQFIGFDSLISQNGNDFMSCLYHADTLYTVWGDTRTGKMNIFFAKTIASTDSTVSISLLEGDEKQLLVFPNPVNNELNIAVGNEAIGKEVSVFDASGKKVYSSTISSPNLKLSTATWQAGVYFVKVDGEVKRVVKD